MADFLDLTEAQLVQFMQNWAAKLSVHEAALTAIAPADVTQAAADSTLVQNAINAVNQIREDAREWTQMKNLILYSPAGTALPGVPTAATWPAHPLGAAAAVLARVRDLANRIKADAAYTEAIGQDLGIVGTGITPGTDAPTLTGRALTGFQVEIAWLRGGHDAVKIQSQRASETVWTDLTIDTISPYVDTRAPLSPNTPEERRYRAAYVDDDVVTTGWSDVVVVTAQA